MTKKVYLGGPMRGYPKFNFPAFAAAAIELRAKGYEVFSPAEKDEETYGKGISDNATGDEDVAAASVGFTIRKAMEVDCRWICRNADIIALLPGWEKSKGATAEKALAECIGAEVMYL